MSHWEKILQKLSAENVDYCTIINTKRMFYLSHCKKFMVHILLFSLKIKTKQINYPMAQAL